MLIPTITFFLGVLLAPVIRPLLRPIFVELIRATLMTADEVRRLTAEMRENIEDAAAEAKAQHEARTVRDVGGKPTAAEPAPPPASSEPGAPSA